MSEKEPELGRSGNAATTPSAWSCLRRGVGAASGLGLGLMAGVTAMLASLWLEPAIPSLSVLLLVAGTALASACAAVMLTARGRRQLAAGPAAPIHVSEVEHLSDIRWQVSESQAHYRDLLDAQADLIARRDAGGNLTFVNRAFCRTFAVDAERVLGTRFEPARIASDRACGDGRHPAVRTELVETAEGPRWIAWTKRGLGTSGTIHEATQIVGRDVTEERRAAAELASARDEAVAATEAKSRFLARMSHEIRTPMGGVLGMAGLLRQTRLTEEQASHVGVIEHTARELLKLINEILDLAKVEAGRLDIVTRRMSPCSCVQSVVELLAPQAHEKGLELAWSVTQGLPEAIDSDEARCRQILLNLVGNAIKFTTTGGVCVTLGNRRPGFVSFEVRDTGPGIAVDALDRLFNEFEQHAAATTERVAGTGLGLAISRHLARALGGDITVASEAGKGSVFTLTVPALNGIFAHGHDEAASNGAVPPRVLIALDRTIEASAIADTLTAAGVSTDVSGTTGTGAAIAAAAAAAEPYSAVIAEARLGVAQASSLLTHMRRMAGSGSVRGIVIVETSERDKLQAFRAAGFDAYLVRPVRPHALLTYVVTPTMREDGDRPANARLANETPRRAAPHRVLLVEDNAVGALLGMRMLNAVGATALLARSGEEAVAAATAPTADCAGAAIDLVLMDIHLPGIDGLEATARIKAHFAARGQPAPPIVALTASAYFEDRQRCLAAGLDDFMGKPFERQELEAVIEKWCGQRQTGSREGALDEFAA